MPLPIHIALVPDKVDVDPADVTRIAAALSKQVLNDFQPHWGVSATVDGFTRLEDVPTDSWPIMVVKDVKDAAGFHEDDNGQPFAVVEFGPQWSLTASQTARVACVLLSV